MDSPSPRPRGRPKDAGKRVAILNAARRLFLQRGAERVALDAVIVQAGVSKATFYANFADRAALLEAVVRQEAERIVHDPTGSEGGEGCLETDLAAFGLRLLLFLTHPDMLGFERLIGAAARAHPDLPERFFKAGPGRSRRALAERIAAGVRAGRLSPLDPAQAAEDLIGLWQGMMRVEQAMGVMPTPSEADLQARAARGVRLFMRLYGAPEAPTSAPSALLNDFV